MAVNILKSPYRNYPGGDASVSKWVAINNDVIFKLQRKDLAITGSNFSGSNIRLLFSGGTMVWALTIGGRIYWEDSVVPENSGVYTVISYTTTEIVISAPAVTHGTVGFVCFLDNWSNYKLSATFEKSLDKGVSWLPVSTSDYRPSPTGQAIVNVKPFLMPLVKATSKAIPASTVNDIADDIDMLCRVTIFEQYLTDEDGQVSQQALAAQELRIVDMSLQIGSALNGVNLLDYVSDLAPVTPTPHYQKWLGAFLSPTRFKNFPFHLSFIYSELMTGAGTYYETELNGVTLLGNYTIDKTKKEHVNRVFLHEGYSAGLESLLVAITYDGTFPNIWAQSEQISVKLNNCTIENPVCIKWIYKGAWNFWVFGTQQQEGCEVSNSQGTFNIFNEDLDTAESRQKDVQREATPDMILGAEGLTVDEVKALNTIPYSPSVMILTNPTTWQTDGDKWMNVTPGTGKYKIRNTRAARNSFEMTIKLPELYTEQN